MLHQSSSASEMTINEDEEEFDHIDASTLSREDLNSMTITQLKNLLKSKGKKVAGNKSELINRLLQSSNGREDSALLSNGNGPSSTNYAFSATPITITLQQPVPKETKPAEEVNFATLRFNAKLNEMSKNMGASTAPKVESLLLDALNKYEQHVQNQTANNTSNPRELIIPNTVSFTNAITAWARCSRKDSPHRAQALLDKMHYLYKVRKWSHVKPNKISYNSVINAWARSTERGSGRKAEKLLNELWKFWEEEGREWELKPDARSFNSVINAIARSREKDCADRAKDLLDEMGRLYNEGDTELLPHAVSFGAIINAYANSLEEGASDKAAQLLMHMESLYQLGFENAKPTTFVYNACMNAFAKDPCISVPSNDAAKKAEQLLASLEKRYDEERDGRVKPDCISYSTVINAYANSATVQSGINADVILRRMINRYLLGDNKCRPNAVAFTATIKAHSAAINATTSSLDCAEDGNVNEMVKTYARRCEDLLQQLCLLRRSHGFDQSLKPTGVTFDLVLSALTQVKDWDGVERVKKLRDEESSNTVERIKLFQDEES
ncbi:hypothetical protein HJC23_001920 [Cyclotella cryptica]|uniref:SAP domain-containing protein n=1 Tax=Cyclotella cryptica TaxID=29204 RepID=A0ABD3P3E8_9STRA